jgi:FkbM family methyltransferase
LATSIPVPLRVTGLDRTLKLRLHDERDRFVSRRIRESGIWEPFETKLVLGALAEGCVFVDVGANIGYFSVIAAEAVGDAGKVFAFEPEPENFALLQANLSLNDLEGRVVPVRAALSDTKGQGRLYLSRDNLGDHQIYGTEEARDSIEVPLLDGGRYLEAWLERIDLLKVDTQGSEYRVIAGLMPLLRQLSMSPRVLIELTPLSLREAGSSGRALVELLATLEQDFWIVDHLAHRLVASSACELADWSDAVDAVKGDRGFMNILVGAFVATP